MSVYEKSATVFSHQLSYDWMLHSPLNLSFSPPPTPNTLFKERARELEMSKNCLKHL